MIRILSTARAFPTDGSAAERSKWNTEFEEGFLKQIYPEGSPTQNIFENNPFDVRTIQLRIKAGELEREVVSETMFLLHLQRLVHMDGNMCLSLYDLEARWQSTPLERRREIALESICAVCSRTNFPQRRLTCPEMTQENLSQEFISLLKSWTMSDATQLDIPILLPNDKFEEYMRPPVGYEAELEPYIQYKRLQRTHCLLWTIIDMLALFQSGKGFTMHPPLETLRTRKENKMTEEERAATQELNKLRSGPGGLRPKSKEERTGVTGVFVCFNRVCPKHNPDRAAGTKMMACTRCNKNGIRVTYCSAECQTRDWKEGHRRICGLTKKPVEEPKAPLITPFGPGTEADSAYIATGIPTAVTPFVHSPAVRCQITMLLESRDIDYWLVDPANLSRILGFVCADTISNRMERLHFHIARRRAMTSGDQNAVYIMYRAIISAAPRLGFSLPAVGKQLQREYGIQINEEDNEERKLDPVPEDKELFLVGEFLKTVPISKKPPFC